MKAWLGLRLSVLGLAFCACATDSTSGEDSGSDASLFDANQDANANKDASQNDASDASDATVDTGDAASDAPMDADIDAPDDGSVSDGGPFDAGKGCLGVFCIKGDKCCNLVTSSNYGKCEAIACLACCM